MKNLLTFTRSDDNDDGRGGDGRPKQIYSFLLFNKFNNFLFKQDKKQRLNGFSFRLGHTHTIALIVIN